MLDSPSPTPISIRRVFAMLATLVVIAATAAVGVVALRVSTGAHAWLAAEQIWIESRRNAVDCLTSHVRRRRGNALTACSKPFDRLQIFARLKDAVDARQWGRARELIEQLGVSAQTNKAAIDLFQIAREIPMVAAAFQVWNAGLEQIEVLRGVAQDFDRLVDDGAVSDAQVEVYLNQIKRANTRLREQEDSFASLLHKAGPRANLFGGLSVAIVSLLLLVFGALFWREARRHRAARNLAEQKLARREERLRSLIEHMREPVLVADPSALTVVEANPAFFELLDRHPDELPIDVGSFATGALDEVRACLAGMERGEELVELRWRTASGELRDMQITGYRVPDDERIYLIARDVTDQRDFERRLLEVDRMVAVGTLAAGVGHEINNPLTFIIGGINYAVEEIGRICGADAAAIQDDPEAHKQRLTDVLDALEDARTGSHRVRDIVRDLRTFSRADERERPIEPVELGPILDLAVEMARSEFRHVARLERDYADAPVALANESRLAQVFLNLLINAAHAIESAGAVREHVIRVAAYADDGDVVVEVSDTGTGIDEDERAMVFEPFRTTKPVGKGTGLGLPISRNIVEALGGSLRFESEPGVGATFYVRLPAAPS